MPIQPRLWYATGQAVYEIYLVENNECIIKPFGEHPQITVNLRWGQDDKGFVFQLGRMPPGKEQLRLPLVVEGGYLTGNKEIADQMHAMLKGVVALAAQSVLISLHNVMAQTSQNLEHSLDDSRKLPTILGASLPEKTGPEQPTPSTSTPQAVDDDGPDSDSDYIVG